MNIFFIIFCIFFMIIGFVDSIKFTLSKIFQKSCNRIKNSDNAEFVIRSFVNKSLWEKNCDKLICVDSSDNETKKIIALAKNDFDFLNFKLIDK